MTEVTPELEAARKEYEDKFGNNVPNNKKNDIEWIEAKNAEVTEDNGDSGENPPTHEVKEAPEEFKELGEKLKKQGKLGNFYSGKWKMNIVKDGITYSINK